MRQSERSRRTRDLILDAAAAEICQRGFGSTSLSAIVSAAAVNPGSLHYHFKTKLAIAVHIVHNEELEWLSFWETGQPTDRRGIVSLASLGILIAERALARPRARATLILAVDRGAAESGLSSPILRWRTTVQALLFEAVALGQLEPSAASNEAAAAVLGAFIGYFEVCHRMPNESTMTRQEACAVTRIALRAGGICPPDELLTNGELAVDDFLRGIERLESAVGPLQTEAPTPRSSRPKVSSAEVVGSSMNTSSEG